MLEPESILDKITPTAWRLCGAETADAMSVVAAPAPTTAKTGTLISTTTAKITRRHLPSGAACATELASDFQTCACALDGDFSFHFSHARPHVYALLLKLADKVDQMLDNRAEPVQLQTTRVFPSRRPSRALSGS